MTGTERELGLARAWGAARRHRVVVAATALLLAGAGLFVVKRLRPTYAARAVVRIDDPRPVKDYIMPTVLEPEPGEGLKSARLGLLAYPVVEEAAGKLGLLPPERDRRERVVASLAGRLDARQEGMDTYVVTFEDGDRARAQKFLGALIDAYRARRAVETTTRANAAAKFFNSQVDDLRPRVADAEAKVEGFRLEHYGSLPDQLDSNLRLLDDMQANVHTLAASLDAAQARRRDILADTSSPIRHQEEAVAAQLAAARARYNNDAPEVKALEAQLAAVHHDRVSDEDELSRRVRASAELHSVDGQIDSLTAQIADLGTRETELQKRIGDVAKNGDQLARLGLERDLLRDRLRALVARELESELAAGMEAELAGGERVTVVTPSWASPSPVKPAKPLLAMLVLAGALLLAFGAAWLVDAADRRVHPSELKVFIGELPVFGVVPSFAPEVIRGLH
jgi:uncharacterized protein involved in exopolysaccharide biosynthesis